jgi:protein-S-isoprenylcysteine O-methyltransferase Ste14
VSRLPSLGRRGEGWFALQLLLLAGIFVAGLLVGGDWRGALRGATDVGGAAVLLAGIALVALGVRDLGRSLTPLPAPAAGGTLVEHGAYARIRHPIYTGLMASALGFAVLSASVAALVLTGALAVLLDLKARREEAWLRERYPDYDDYARRTRRFVPGIY